MICFAYVCIYIVVSPEKHSLHIGIMTPASSSLSALSYFWIPVDNCLRDASILFKLYSLRKLLTELWPFFIT